MVNQGDLNEPGSSGREANFSKIFWNCDLLNARNCHWDYNSSENINDTSSVFEQEKEKVYWALLMIPLPLVAVVGNILVILSVYKERSLQTATNYFIVSLAFADLLVAAVVMPFAVYVLVNVDWDLSETLCDFYIALDVTCSTASIFNLVAISIDRFIAVTQPIKYSKHKNNKRVFLTIAVVWLVSAAIGSPIVLGLNTSPERIPNLCIFYNSDFIIYSSLSSFYIPCIVMIYLYYKIFRAIHERAKKAIGQKSASKSPAHCGLIIENTSRLDSMLSETKKNSEIFRNQLSDLKEIEEEDNTYQEATAEMVTNSNEDGEEGHDGLSLTPETIRCRVIGNKTALPFNGSQNKDSVIPANYSCDSEKVSEEYLEEETKFLVCDPHTHSPLNVAHEMDSKTKTNGTTKHAKDKKIQELHSEHSLTNNPLQTFEVLMDKKRSRFSLTKHQKSSKKKKEKNAVRRERKATKTLAIVLGMFLMCWVPFFTCNILDAICIKLQSDSCRPGVTAFLLTTWLGYVNSCVNPVIYTIFNIEFRKAFKKLLLEPCK